MTLTQVRPFGNTSSAYPLFGTRCRPRCPLTPSMNPQMHRSPLRLRNGSATAWHAGCSPRRSLALPSPIQSYCTRWRLHAKAKSSPCVQDQNVAKITPALLSYAPAMQAHTSILKDFVFAIIPPRSGMSSTRSRHRFARTQKDVADVSRFAEVCRRDGVSGRVWRKRHRNRCRCL